MGKRRRLLGCKRSTEGDGQIASCRISHREEETFICHENHLGGALYDTSHISISAGFQKHGKTWTSSRKKPLLTCTGNLSLVSIPHSHTGSVTKVLAQGTSWFCFGALVSYGCLLIVKTQLPWGAESNLAPFAEPTPLLGKVVFLLGEKEVWRQTNGFRVLPHVHVQRESSTVALLRSHTNHLSITYRYRIPPCPTGWPTIHVLEPFPGVLSSSDWKWVFNLFPFFSVSPLEWFALPGEDPWGLGKALASLWYYQDILIQTRAGRHWSQQAEKPPDRIPFKDLFCSNLPDYVCISVTTIWWLVNFLT